MERPAIAKLKVLVADDHAVIRRIVDQYLREMGFQHIDTVSNSDEAERKIMTGDYSIAFLDWHMPGKSGFALMKECREDRKFDKTAFVMVTAESHERSVIEALKAGATSYITKPVSKAVFDEKVTKVINWLQNSAALKTADSA